jgi:hypothetical protein
MTLIWWSSTTNFSKNATQMLKGRWTLDLQKKNSIPLVPTWLFFPPAFEVWSVEPYLPYGCPPTSQPMTAPLQWVHPGGSGQWGSGQLGEQDSSSEKIIHYRNFDMSRANSYITGTSNDKRIVTKGIKRWLPWETTSRIALCMSLGLSRQLNDPCS